ncbi:MAG: VOC family protein [Saprospiraceae bacterium]|nr:VOC family protein [Saprospiraceae bacterium]
MAIRVRDIEASAIWYEEILGLQRFQPEAWKPFPIMMLAGQSGIALFPDTDPPTSRTTKDAFHIAFRIGEKDLHAMRQRLVDRGMDVIFEDHVCFHSIYFRDPDGYRLEITAEVRLSKS